MQQNLTSGSVFQNVVRFSLPYLLSYFLQTLYGMADLFIVGQFEPVAATTAVSIGSQVMHMLTVMLVGLAMGTTVTTAQAVGAGDKKRAARAVGNTVTLFGGISALLTVVLLLLVRRITAVMSTPAEAVDGTVRYLTICFLGIPFITAYNILSSIFRGMGDSKSPMYFIACACVCNIALDYLFIGAMHLGPAGAALGTTLSQAISVLLVLLTIRKRGLGLPLHRSDLRPDKAVSGDILKIGLPITCQDGLIQVAFIVITVIANQRGLTDAAAVGIVEKVISFLFLVPSSMLSTVSRSARRILAPESRNAPERRFFTPSCSRQASALSLRRLSSSSPNRSSASLRRMKRPSSRAGSICAGIFSTAFSQASTSASAATSAPAENRGCRFCTISQPLSSSACRACG